MGARTGGIGVSALDIYLGPAAPVHMLTSSLARGRAAVTVRPGLVGIEECLLVEDRPQHVDFDWAVLAARGGVR